MNPHPDPEQLSAYIDGELTGTDRDDLEQHLTGCSECSATVRGLRATVADMRALPSPALSEQDQWALRSAISKARRRPAERYRRWVVGAGSAAAVAAAIVGVLSLNHNKANTTSGRASSEVHAPALGAPSAQVPIQVDQTNYNSSTARSLLLSTSNVYFAPAQPQAAPTTKTAQAGTSSTLDSTISAPLADQSRYGPQIATCERDIFSSGSGGARAIAYVVGRYESTPAFFLIYSVVVGGKTEKEMWVVRQSDCYIRLFLAPQ